MFLHILVPLDGSKLAEEVLPHARDLASRLGSTIHLLRVVPEMAQVVNYGLVASGEAGALGAQVDAISKALSEETERARKYLEEVGRGLKDQGLQVEWETRRGDAASQIIRYVKERGIDLVAISTHGRSGLSRLVFGSVAEKVLREAGVPVLLIKPDGE